MSYGVTREKAMQLVRDHIQSENLVSHCLAAEAVLLAAAESLGEERKRPDQNGPAISAI